MKTTSVLYSGLMALALVLGATSCNQTADTNEPVAKTPLGQIKGTVSDNNDQIAVYKGIPYAVQPVGEKRWTRPEPTPQWDTVMIAQEFGKISIQPAHTDPESFYTKEFYWMGDPEMGEDCLYLNVWTPKEAVNHPEKKLPVAMWIHGGAYINGWGNEITMDGDEWAKRGVILVTINYRLGTLGFMANPLLNEETENHTSGNYGTLDQIAALKWIKSNISAFGGDPDNVSIFGQSAGAGSVKNLISSPLSKNLISKAIIQSGGGIGRFIGSNTIDNLAQKGADFMATTGCTTMEQMRALTPEQLKAYEDEYKAKSRSWMLFSPVIDNYVLTGDFNEQAYKGELADIPYMIGSNSDDMGDMRPQTTRFAEVQDSLGRKPVYVYHFERRLPGDESGAFHSAELWYVFGTLQKSWRPFTEQDYALSAEMLDYWTNFVKTGDPNGENLDEWAPCTKENTVIKTLNIK
jgi:para-nitrobenzyl esterase